MNDERGTKYEGEPGAIPLRALNIAPATGERLIGFVPYGLTAVVADNMAGKSRILSALSAIPLSVLKPGMLSVTDGQTEGRISFGAAELRVEERESAGRSRRSVKRSEATSEGPIEQLPDPIELMVTGGNHVSEEANWRVRMRALNDFHPVAVTPERLVALAGEVLPPPHEDLCEALLDRHSAEPFASLLEAAEWLAGGRGELNKRALATEAHAADVARNVARGEGALRERLEKVAAELGADPTPVFERGLLNTSDEDIQRAEEQFMAATRAAASIRSGYERRAGELERREALRKTHGERPSVADAAEAVRIEQDTCDRQKKGNEEIEAEIARLQGALAEQRERLAASLARLDAAKELERSTVADIVKWDDLNHELSKPIAGATLEDLTEAENELERAAARHRLCGVAGPYRSAFSACLAEKELQERTETVARTLRGRVPSVWRNLGELMTGALETNLLRVREGSLEIRNEDGRWLDVSDDERLSAGRLRRAFLDFWLERCPEGINVVIEDTMMLPIGPEGRREISARAAAKRVRLLFEQPGSPKEPELEWYGGE